MSKLKQNNTEQGKISTLNVLLIINMKKSAQEAGVLAEDLK